MKKKLTKEQKENRLKRFRKVKDITLYISLAINTLFVILMCVVGCSSNNVDEHKTTNYVQLQRNELVDRYNQIDSFNILSNENTICYDILNVVESPHSYLATGEYTYFQTDENLILFSIEGALPYITHIHIDFNVSYPSVSGNYMRIEGLRFNSSTSSFSRVCGRYYGFTDGQWSSINLEGLYSIDTSNGYYLAFNIAQTTENQFGLNYYLEHMFSTIDYKDYDLSINWSPYGVFSFNEYLVYEGLLSDMIYPAIDGSVFFINGKPYNQLQFDFVTNELLNGQYHDVNVSYLGQNIELASGKPYSILLEVRATNTTSNNSISLMSIPKHTYVQRGDGYAICYATRDMRFTDFTRSRVRLYAVNLNKSTYGGYTNGNVLDIEYNFPSAVADNNFGNIFALITTSFSGLVGLLEIQILPNITIGILLFLPLIAMIIFALIKVIKK